MLRGIPCRFLLGRFLLAVFLGRYLLAGLTVCCGTVADSRLGPSDLRIAKLDTFFMSYGCPTPHHALDYVSAADAFEVDYRLLPAISLLESTCGSYGRMNNHWGWNGTRGAFDSVPAGIAFVTSRLAEGGPYRDKALDDKLFAYNQGSSYARKVKHLMTQIESEPPAAGTNSPANADSPLEK